MRFFLLCSGLWLGLCGCSDKVAEPKAESPPETQPGNVVAAPSPPKPVPTATAEQIRSSVRLRVTVGGVPRHYTGALLHRSEVAEGGAFLEKNRCVLALLTGFTEAQLRSPSTSILVFRNLSNGQGISQGTAYSGRLAHFDSVSGAAAILYHQGFSSETDGGFRIGRPLAPNETATALRFDLSGGERALVPAEAVDPGFKVARLAFQPIPSLPLIAGSFSLTGAGNGTIAFPERDPRSLPDASPLIAMAPDQLAGFITETGAGVATLVPIKPPSGPFHVPIVKPLAIEFLDNQESRARFALRVEVVDAQPVPKELFVKIAQPDAGTAIDLASLKEPFAPIPTKGADQVAPLTNDRRNRRNPVEFALESPVHDGDQRTYLVQLAWRDFEEEVAPSQYSRPFLVKLHRKSSSIVSDTEGIGNSSVSRAVADGRKMEFFMEAPVLRIVEIAGGREVLMQLQGEPFWKRFSMEKAAWLPLPPVNLANVDLAGNRSSLFVLERNAGEVRSYRLSDLSPAGVTKVAALGEQFSFIRAGCNSDCAPIHIISDRGMAALDANTLRFRGSPNSRRSLWNGAAAAQYRSTGDGMTLFVESNQLQGPPLSYSGDFVGMETGYFDVQSESNRRYLGFGVSGAYDLWALMTCANPRGEWEKMPGPPLALEHGTRCPSVPNSPVMLHPMPGSQTPRLQFFGYFDSEPFAEIQVPEMTIAGGYDGRSVPTAWPGSGQLASPGGASSGPKVTSRVCFDPFSKRIGIQSPDSKTWVVRQIAMDDVRRRPVLLNWPDTSIVRGGEFQFTPLLLGKGALAAELMGTREPTALKVDDKSISFRLAANELASFLLLNIKVTGVDGKIVTYPIPLHVQGAPMAFVWPDLNPGTDPQWFAAGPKTLAVSKVRRKGLESTFHVSADPVKAVYGPVAGHLALLTTAKRIDFLSMATKKVAGSVSAYEQARYYPGCGALFEYHALTRELIRISVPEGRREQKFTIPERFQFEALGLGNESGQPLSLFLVRRDNEQSARFGDYIITTWQDNCTILVLNGQTLKAGAWMQPVAWTGKPNPSAMGGVVRTFFNESVPKRVVGSRDGSILITQDHLVVISPRYSMAVPFPAQNQRPFGPYRGDRAIGSITGLIAVDADGAVYRNGVKSEDGRGSGATPCGRYQIIARVEPPSGVARSFEVRTMEGNRPLFRLNRLVAMKEGSEARERIRLLGDNGPLLFHSGDKVLQFVDFDIPRLAQELCPEKFHVISQPMPCLVEGGIYDYPIQVNHPVMVGTYRLRSRTASATISANGVLRFVAPQSIRKPEQVDIAIEIVGKDGSIVLHEFPLIVMPRHVPLPAPPSGKTRPAL